MSVYAICSACDTRWDVCQDQTGHRAAKRWRADVHFGPNSVPSRLRKTFLKKDNADIQERQWLTDQERGLLLPKNNIEVKSFDEVADEWSLMAIGQNLIKDFNRAEKYRVKQLKNLFGSKTMGAITFKHGEDWINARRSAGISIGTVNRDLKTAKWIFDYAIKKDYLKINPFKDIKELKGANIRVRWMTEAEINELVSCAMRLEGMELVDVIDVGLNTGFRKGNLERLTARDVSNNLITASKTKSGKPYDVPIAPDLVPCLQRLITAHPTGPLLNTTKLDRRFREAVRATGLYKEKGNPDNVTIHTLRHTYAALYLKRGGDVYKLRDLLGHSSVTITEKVYGHLCPDLMKAQAPLTSTKIKRDFIPVPDSLECDALKGE